MFQELRPNAYDKARPLFQEFDYSLSIYALIEGNNPGRIFVDDPARPRTALALTVEGALLAGEHEDTAANAALSRLFNERIFTGEVYVDDDWCMFLALHPDAWEARLPELIPTHQADKRPRYHYLCREVKFDWRENLPAGYSVRRSDHDLLNDPTLVIPEALPGWIKTAWGSVDHFVAKGAGFCVLHDNEIVSWCTSDCAAGDCIDVGIHTATAHRRRGLASVATAATVEYCLGHGFRAVGWHCDQDNPGSWKTAEKAGFERTREYFYYFYIFDQVNNLAQLGWSCYKRGEYEQTRRYFERVFAARDDHPDYFYHLAAAAWAEAEDTELTLKYLRSAVERGWRDIEMTKGMEAFRFLHGTPEWEGILSLIRRNAA